MKASRAKQFVGLTLALIAVGGVAAALVLAGQSVLATGTGANPALAFSQAPTVPEDLGDLVTWQTSNADLARQVEPTTQLLIEAAWVSAWQQVDMVQRDSTAETEARFMPQLADRVSEGGTGVQPAALVQHSHLLSTTFYSLDGSVITLDITSDLERVFAHGPALRTTDRYEVVMLLSDGKWRVLRLTRIGAAIR